MANPARLLLTLFRNWDTTGRNINAQTARGPNNGLQAHVDAAGYLAQLAQLIDTLSYMGREVDHYKRRLANWTNAVFVYPQGWSGNYPPFDQGDMDVLLALAETLDSVCPKPDPDKLAQLLELIDGVIETLEDSGLPTDLKAHIQTVAEHCRRCIQAQNQHSDFELQNAVDQLLVALNLAETSANDASERGRWTTFKDKFVYPFFVSFFANGVVNPAIQSVVKELGG